MQFERRRRAGVAFALHRSAAEQRPLVLLHGLGNSARFWNGLLRHLAERTTLVPDIPGFGESATSESGYDVVAVARNLAKLIDALGLQRPVLVGHSMGAVVALELARWTHASGLVTVCGTPLSALAVLSTPGGFMRTPSVALNLGAQLVGGSLPVAAPLARLVARNSLLRRVALHPFVRSSEGLDPDVVAMAIRGAGGFGPLKAVLGARGYDLEAALRELSAPAALIAGEHDRLISAADHRRAVEIVRPKHSEVLPGIGHWPMIEAPAMLGKALDRSFQAIGRST